MSVSLIEAGCLQGLMRPSWPSTHVWYRPESESPYMKSSAKQTIQIHLVPMLAVFHLRDVPVSDQISKAGKYIGASLNQGSLLGVPIIRFMAY